MSESKTYKPVIKENISPKAILISKLMLWLLMPSLMYGQISLDKVVGITDGDTVTVLRQDSLQIKVRVANIDCPERKQPFSKRAKQFTSMQVFDKEVKLEFLKKDRYGRHICNVIYNDSLSLSKELLKNGMAWHYVKYSNDSTLQVLEDYARLNKIGLWQDPNAIPPWEWRSTKRKKK